MSAAIGRLGSMMPPAAMPAAMSSRAGAPEPDVFTRRMEALLEQEDGRQKLETVREQAKKLVSEAFLAPVLAKVRETNQAAAPFGTTDVEKRFGPILDRAVADAMVRPDRFPLVKAVERSMLQKMLPHEGVSA